MCFLFPDPQNEIGPSISSSVVLCSFVLLVYIVALVLVFYSCPSSVRVVATFPGTILFPLLIQLRNKDFQSIRRRTAENIFKKKCEE